ncbi:hypothetical protein VY88_27060 [Azospirillum thiophilum]|uniref:Uncharacterized protein n=1 Tax=Azospirillum thiophilum TaxID=528244 RepID=A0AAC8W4Z4_9PROT|nr:hypothetical protein [Azospirillum thiophilum]ALG75166.1 hypothetical protein AL072_29970 [Azospirillum thiophilum]KJR62558.1 hypothetical protein VY88_27060 [Azospirillum thiophilum]
MTGPRDLDPGIALSLACGRVLTGKPHEDDRAALAEAIFAVPDRPSAARGLAQVATAWLSGDFDNRALVAALTVFNAPFCDGRSAGRRPHPPAAPGAQMPRAAATHAARVAQALED